MGRYKTLLQNTGLMFIGSFGSKIISFIMLPFYTMWLSVEDFGTSDLITVYSTIVLAFASLCIGEAIFVIPTQKEKEQQSGYFTSSILFSLFCIILLVLLYFVVSLFFSTSNNSFVNNIIPICLITATTLYTTIFQQFCKGINMIKVFATAGIIQTITVALTGFLLIPRYQLNGYIGSMLIANIITMIYVFFVARLFEYINVKSVSCEKLKELFSYSIPLIPNSVIWLIVSYLNRPLMEASLGLYALGIYSLANRFPTLINTLYNIFSNSWQISILDQYGKEGFCKFYNNVILLSFCIMSILVISLSLLINPIITLFFNSNYYEAISYIPLLCLSCLFISLGSMIGAIFAAVKKSKYYFYSSVWSAAAAILFNFILIPKFGIYGACWACVISYLIGGFSRLLYAKRFNPILYTKSIITVSSLTTCIVCILSYLGSYVCGTLVFVLLLVYVCMVAQRLNVFSVIKLKYRNKQ